MYQNSLILDLVAQEYRIQLVNNTSDTNSKQGFTGLVFLAYLDDLDL